MPENLLRLGDLGDAKLLGYWGLYRGSAVSKIAGPLQQLKNRSTSTPSRRLHLLIVGRELPLSYALSLLILGVCLLMALSAWLESAGRRIRAEPLA